MSSSPTTTTRALYKDSRKGRPSLPPSLVVLTMLLQYHDDCSDAEAEARVRFDLRWKHALGLPLEDVGLRRHGVVPLPPQAAGRTGWSGRCSTGWCRAARAAGLIAKDAAQVVDSSHVLGAAGVRDTYALIRGGIRKLLRALGYAASTRGAAAGAPALVPGPGRAGEARPGLGRRRGPRRPPGDAGGGCARRPGAGRPGPAASPAVAEAAALLAKIVADDVDDRAAPAARGPSGRAARAAGRRRTRPRPAPAPAAAAPRLRQGVAPDRAVSVVDPELRVGHKSARTAVGRLQGPGGRGADQRVADGGRGPPGQRARRRGGGRPDHRPGGAGRAAAAGCPGRRGVRDRPTCGPSWARRGWRWWPSCGR